MSHKVDDARELIERARVALTRTSEEPMSEREVGVRDALRALLFHLLPDGETLDLDSVVSTRATPTRELLERELSEKTARLAASATIHNVVTAEDRRVMAEAGGIAEAELPWGAAQASAAIRVRDAFVDQLRGLDTETRVRFYEHDFYPLSNFSAFSLRLEGIRFDTSEAAYHCFKFAAHPLIQDEIRCAPSAHAAFKIAEQYKTARRPDWDEVKVDVMRTILRAKVAQHEYVKRKLLATGERELVEDSWRDDFWGWGPKRDGQNMLGKLWMELRAELRGAGSP